MNTNKLFLTLLICLGLFFSIANCYLSAETLILQPNEAVDFQPFLEYYIEEKGELTLEQAKEIIFQPVPGGKATFGLKTEGIWFRVTVNLTPETKDDFFLVLDYPLLDYVDFYLPNLDTKPILRSGDLQFFANRSAKHRLINFLIMPDQPETTEVYYRVQTSGSVQAGGKIISFGRYHELIAEENLILGIYYGAIIVLGVYNLFIFFFLREKSYLIYTIYIGIYLMAQMVMNGTAFSILFPGFPKIPNLLLLISFFQSLFWAFVFTFVFLNQNIRSKVSYIGLVIMSALFLGTLASLFFEYKYMVRIFTVFAIITPPFFIIFGSLRLREGYKPARYFLLAWCLLTVGMVLYGLKTANIVPANPVTEYVIQIGSLAEALLLSLGLAYRFDLIRLENQKYSAELKVYSEKLEERVQERTAELERTYSTLESTQKNLVQSEKKAAITQLAAGLAHELNNPLNYIAVGVPGLKKEIHEMEQLLMEMLPVDGEPEAVRVRDYFTRKFDRTMNTFKDLESGVRRTAEIVSEVRGLTELDGQIIKPVSIRELVRKELYNARLLLLEENKRNKILVSIDTQKNSVIETNPFVFGRILRNLFSNALYYAYQVDKPEIRIRQEIKPCCRLRLMVANNGPAIGEDDENKIFNMFYTTKKIGEGKGTGLALASSLSVNINGSVFLADPGRESGFVTFAIELN